MSHFLPFYPKISKKWKRKHLEISLFYTCVQKITTKWCTVLEIWCATDGRTDGLKKWHIGAGDLLKNEKQNKKMTKKKKKQTKRKTKKNHHEIFHIQVSLSSKFQIPQTILIFWKKFFKREYSWSKQQKINISKCHISV